MSDLYINIRFGVHHLQLNKNWEWSYSINNYHIDKPPKTKFHVYEFFWYQGSNDI